MYIAVIVAVLTVVTALPQADYNRYVGYKVLEIVPTSQDQVATLHRMMIENTEFDFWQEPSRRLDPVHVMAGPQQMARLTTQLRKGGMAWTVYKDHIERDIDEFVAKERLRRSHSKKVFDINDFNTYEDILGWLQDQMTTCNDNGLTCEYYDAEPPSVEGRAIKIFTVSSDGDTSKPVFFLDATIHAREWLAPATILKIMDNVLSGNGNELLANVNFVFMPVYNPDGYEYSWTNERLWRKNRNPGSTCVGVDLNRNGDFRWGEEGVSHNECSDVYCGTGGNSEPETQALRSELERYANGINNGGAYVTFHAYGNMWMHPWGNTINYNGGQCERADDHDDMFAVADATADAIQGTHSTSWARGTSCEVIYATTGGTDDYAKGGLGIKYPFCPELRGNGFIVSADEIQPSFEEIWAGLVAKYGALNP